MFQPKPLTLAILSSLALSPLTVHAEATALSTVEISSTATDEQTINQSTEALTGGNSETGSTLRQLPGIEASRMGGHGVDLFIRGQSASQLNVILDGAKIEGACPNRMDPPTSYAELSSFDNITVVKGVESVLYGSGGTGGTVLLERSTPTFSDDKAYQGKIEMGTGSNGLKRELNGEIAAGGNDGYIVLQASQKAADNYFDGDGNEIESSYDTNQARIDVGLTPSDQHELKLSYENSRTDNALYEGASMNSPLSDGDTTRLSYNGYKLNNSIDEVEADIYLSHVDHIMVGKTNPAMVNTTEATTRGAKLQLTSVAGQTQFDYGLQLEGIDKFSDLTNAGVSQWYMWPGVESETRAVFAEAKHALNATQKVTFGLRYENANSKANLANVAAGAMSAVQLYNNAYNTYSGATENDQTYLNSVLRLNNKHDSGYQSYIGLSQTYRAGDATELFIAKGSMGNTKSWVGNPDLKPEQHNQLDIGISRFLTNYSWSVSAYYDSVNDYILRDLGTEQADYNFTGESTGYFNKDATLYGIETSANWQANQNLNIEANISFTRGSNDTDNRNLSNIAPVNGSVSATYSKAKWNAGMRWTFAADQTEVNELYNELETAGWNTLDLFANYQINKRVSLSAGVDNLFDHAYENYLNRTDATTGADYKVYEPGRNIWAKLSAKF
ncbi:TonB-dependent receptor domain-containing protein [Thiomicrorhabdus sediminis]|uniref:TonB-dependent receptor n=1 Tax=Thiomicrorhabdus sediminis TaxID=2580412 RepID=A0A4V1HHQ3_9GAMM|nr:TonB-dependent receptor [Thiomicrorhabdus sediminis]QCU89823.1 TonB-dependent receptor [Thiomicrorhabdus sediminis]